MPIYHNYPTKTYQTLKQLYRENAALYGEKPLFMQKDGGVYKKVSYRRYRDDVDALGTELLCRGLGGKHIAIIGENCYAWVTAYMAVICGVGTVVPIDKDASPDRLAQLLRAADTDAVIVSPTYAEKLKKLPASLPRISFDELPRLIRTGRERIQAGESRYLDCEPDPHAMSAILFTSGTTQKARGVMLSHRNLCFNLSEMCRMVYIDDRDIFLSILPLHHAYEATCGFLCPLSRGATVAFGEGLSTLSVDMRVIRPSVMLCVPLLIETFYQRIWDNLKKQELEDKVKRTLKTLNTLPEPMRQSAKKRLFAEIHKSFGGNLRLLISGGGSVDPNTLGGLRDLGIQALQGYGLTECAPLITLNRDTHPNDRSVGMSTPGTLLDIAEMQDDGAGEIRFRGDNVMLGYYNAPKLTAQVIRDGWLYTGDLGYLDENGFLYVTGRRRNAILTAQGQSVFPEEIEALLNRSELIRSSAVLGYRNPTTQSTDIVAVICPDYHAALKRLGNAFSPERMDFELKKEISDVNGALLPYKRVTQFLLYDRELPKNTSQKIRRAGLHEKFEAAYRKRIGQS